MGMNAKNMYNTRADGRNLFFGTFVTGLHDAVSRLLVERGCETVLMLDGAALFKADEGLQAFPFLHNVFRVLAWEESKPGIPLEGRYLRRKQAGFRGRQIEKTLGGRNRGGDGA
jgi:hypothetical protein